MCLCSRCGAGMPQSRVHSWCAQCLWEYKRRRDADANGGSPPNATTDLYVFENSRLPGENKIGRSTGVRQRAQGLQRSQSFYIRSVASFEGKGHLEQKVRQMLAHCVLPREVAPGREWHACSLQSASGTIGQAIDSEEGQR